MKSLKILIEKHSDGYVAYPLGLKGVVVGEGDSYEETVQNITEAVQLYIESLKAHSEPVPSEDVIIKPIHVAA